MRADIHVLAVGNHQQLCEALALSLSEANAARLRRRALQWNVSPAAAAEMILADILNPKRKRRQARLIDPERAISMGLTMVVPGPASLVGPQGKAVKQVKEALRLAGYKIEPV